MALPTVRLVVKTHPAEIVDGYVSLAAGLERITIAPASADLARILAASDAVVTRNSTVAFDAMVLGLPALVVGFPSNLSPFVDAGVMMGADPGTIRGSLERVLYDRTVRQSLLDEARAFVAREDVRADGGAARRATDEILTWT
jgi:CDP-glycerol glycerophosphotransferase (TagB/SpsB family)